MWSSPPWKENCVNTLVLKIKKFLGKACHFDFSPKKKIYIFFFLLRLNDQSPTSCFILNALILSFSKFLVRFLCYILLFKFHVLQASLALVYSLKSPTQKPINHNTFFWPFNEKFVSSIRLYTLVSRAVYSLLIIVSLTPIRIYDTKEILDRSWII